MLTYMNLYTLPEPNILFRKGIALEICCACWLLQAITLYFPGLFGLWICQDMNPLPLVTQPVLPQYSWGASIRARWGSGVGMKGWPITCYHLTQSYFRPQLSLVPVPDIHMSVPMTCLLLLFSSSLPCTGSPSSDPVP